MVVGVTNQRDDVRRHYKVISLCLFVNEVGWYYIENSTAKFLTKSRKVKAMEIGRDKQDKIFSVGLQVKNCDWKISSVTSTLNSILPFGSSGYLWPSTDRSLLLQSQQSKQNWSTYVVLRMVQVWTKRWCQGIRATPGKSGARWGWYFLLTWVWLARQN